MKLERRLKRFRIAPDDLALLLQGRAVVTGFALPDDAAIVSMGFDHNYQMLIAVIYSGGFTAVEPDREIPFTLNGPIVEETA